MKKKYFHRKFCILLIAVLSSPVTYAQENGNTNLSLNYGYYNFFKSTWIQKYMVNTISGVPSIGIDIPISETFSINSKAIYLYHKSDAISEVYSDMGTLIKRYSGTTKVTEILLLPKVQMIMYRRDTFTFAVNLGPMLGYIDENFEYSSYIYGSGHNFNFGIVGIAGGLTICNRLKESPFSILLSIDSQYASRGIKGDNSLLREYGGYLLSFGIGLDL
ncbi:MAG: hypothetical protein WCT99_06865 [Bacteroidota bacterium]